MILHLDTTFLVDVLREGRRGDGPARRFLTDHLDDELRMSVFVACELWTGAERSARAEDERRAVEAICAAVTVVYPGPDFASTYARTLAPLQRRGEAIATMDLLIATTALVEAAPLVTRNSRHFGRVDGLETLTY